ncbi:hypothetical protein BKI52_10475 [marine bacterium AO1-C]|nr:hypothetical protein BKI52_10475 [marine bacterium AO1-C]
MTQRAEFTHQHVIITVLLSLVTLGLYIPLWYIINRQAINTMVENKRLSMIGPITVLVLYGLSTIFSIITLFTDLFGATEAVNQYYANIDTLITYIGLVWTIILSFQVQAIFKTYCQGNEYAIGFVGLFTFFLGIFYLQFKVNQLIRYEEIQVWDIDSIGQHLEND